MSKTDVLYLSLTAVAGIILYFQGVRHGMRQAEREQARRQLAGKILEPAWDQEEAEAPLYFFRGRTTLARYHARGVFGRN
jgi:hypothetical protein